MFKYLKELNDTFGPTPQQWLDTASTTASYEIGVGNGSQTEILEEFLPSVKPYKKLTDLERPLWIVIFFFSFFPFLDT